MPILLSTSRNIGLNYSGIVSNKNPLRPSGSFGGIRLSQNKFAYKSTNVYAALEAAAIAAARRNNAALWYIPDSLGGVYQDSAGSVVPALNASIGLLLDRSYGAETLGPELLSNGDFANAAAGYLSASGATVSIVNGNLRVTNGTASYGYSYVNFPTVAGKTYLLATSRRGGSPTSTVNLHLYASGSVGGPIALNVDAANPRTFVALDAQTQIQLYAGGNTVGNYTDYGTLSVREVIAVANLGPELAVNGAFDSATGWLATASGSNSASVTGGVGRIISSDGAYTALSQNTWAPVPGKTYLVAFDLIVTSGAGIAIDFAGTVGYAFTVTGAKRLVITATSSAGFIVKRNVSATDATVDNLTVREVLGYHAVQATAANKPTLVRVPRKLGPERAAGSWSVAAGYDNVISANSPSSFTSMGGATANRVTKMLEALTVGKTYWLTLRVTSANAGTVGVYVREGSTPGAGVTTYNNPAAIQVGQMFTASFVATSATANILFVGTQGSAQNYAVDSISLDEVLEWGYAASFDGTNDVLLAQLPGVTNAFTRIFAHQRANQSAAHLLTGQGTNGANLYYQSGSSVLTSDKATVGIGYTAQMPAGQCVTSEVFTGGNSRVIYGNGAVLASSLSALEYAATGLTGIGASPTATNGFPGTMSLMCLCNTAMPDADRAAIERFAAYLVGAPYVG
jgi:hypothetical protein